MVPVVIMNHCESGFQKGRADGKDIVEAPKSWIFFEGGGLLFAA